MKAVVTGVTGRSFVVLRLADSTEPDRRRDSRYQDSIPGTDLEREQMTKDIKIKLLNVAIILGLLGIISCGPSRNNQPTIDERAVIKSLIEKYKDSINSADAKKGAALFSQASEVSFIHPRGHEHGWPAIEKDIYGMFAEAFVKRDLKTSDEHISVYGDTAWAEFYWVFDGTLKDNTSLQTKGRETQIWKKEGSELRLIHVHYSGLPVDAPRQCF